MGIISKAFSSSNILEGPSTVFMGLPSPTSAPAGAITAADLITIDSSGEPTTTDIGPVTGATNATPIVITVAATSPLANYNIVTISGVLGNTAANGSWTVSGVTGTTFTLVGSAGNGAFSTSASSHVNLGYSLGLVEGPTQLTITPKLEEIRADQFESAIDAALTTVEAEIDVSLMEYNPNSFQRWFTADLVTNPQVFSGNTISTTPLQYANAMQVGGQFTNFANQRTLLVVSPDRSNLGLFAYVFAFRVYLKSALAFQWHRTAKTIFKAKFGCVADFTRQPGDELLWVVRQRP